MKNHITTLIAIIVLQLSLMGQTATAPALGDGSSANPYQIATLENLYWLSQNSAEWDKYYMQTANIDASASSGWDAGAGWTPIGNNTTKFNGYYYGQGYSVNGIFINRPTTDYIGLFGCVSGEIYDLGVTNVHIIGKNYVGGLMGYLTGTMSFLENSYSSGTVTGIDHIGGLLGGNYNGNYYLQLNRCYSHCTVTGHSGVGGLTGRNRAATIKYCYCTGDVTGDGIKTSMTAGVGGLIGECSASQVYFSYSSGNISGITNIGGFAGYNENSSDTIRNCFSRGNVSLLSGTSEAIGGFVGTNSYNAVIQNSYATGNVIGSSFTNKGFVGFISSGSFSNNFWDAGVSTQTSAVGATSKTTAEMKTQTTFTDSTWDFHGETVNGTNDYWSINAMQNDGYPYFKSPIEVTSTSGLTTPKLYGSLRVAFTEINKGIHQGVITIKINGNVNETKSAVLNASGTGSASYSSVILYPTASGLSISGGIKGPLIDLNGSDNVTIDGRVNQTGEVDLTIKNNYRAYNTSAIRYINAAENNILKYCRITGNAWGENWGIIYFSTANSGNGNSGNLIDHCNITQDTNFVINMIYSYGSNGFENKNNTMSNCNIFNFFRPGFSSNGIHLDWGNSDWSINANHFYTTTSLVPINNTNYCFIKVNYNSGNNFTINDNVMGGNAPDNSGMLSINSTYSNQIYGILLNIGTTTASSVQNNTIKNINYTSASTTPFYGIHVNSGKVNVGTVTGNTIGSEIGTGSITITNSTANANSYGIYCNSAGSVNVENNKVGAITLLGSSTYAHSFYGIFKNSTPGTTIFRNNTIGSTVTANSINATSDASTNTQVVCGIYVLGSGTNTISSNTIANLTNATTFASGSVSGIYYGGSTIASSINGNFIHSLSSTSENPSINGIYYGAGNATCSNNIINLGIGITNGNTFVGINGAGSSTLNLYHNTVYIGGIASGTTSNTYALLSTASNTRVYKNNIFNNARTGGNIGKHYAASISSATGLTSDYNDYYAPNGVLGLFSGTDKTTLTSWASSAGGNTNSKNVDPGFASAGGTVAANYLPSESSLAGVTGTGITTDYAGVPNSRSLTYPAMGAWEYPVIGCSAPSISSQSTATQTKCLNGTFSAITVAATGTGLNYQWFSNTVASTSGGGIVNLGSANGAQTNSYTPQATTSGTLYYYCVVTGTCGTATSLVSEAFIVNTPPTAPTSITGTTTICSENTTILTASGGSEGSGCSYEWGTGSVVGSNIISGASSASYTTAALTGNTTYWVRRAGASLCSNTTTGVTQLVSVDIVSATYNTSDTSLCLSGNSFSFSNTSTGTNNKWYFGDGLSSTSTSPSHSYASAGTYSVKLVTSSALNCKDSITKSVYVRSQPMADYSISNNTLCLSGNNFSFTNTSSGTSHLWNFGDGQTSTSNSPSHIYSSANTYNVKLITSSPYNCKDSITKTISVKAEPTSPTSITGTTTICSGSTTMLTASGGSEGSGCSYEWGTGSVVGSNIISGASSASYTTAALSSNTSYWVRRVGTSPCTNTTTGVTLIVVVGPSPTTNFVVADTSLCLSGNNFIFTNTSTGYTSKTWDFGDGVTKTDNVLNFDGLNDYVSVPTMPNPSGSFTIEAIARMTSKGYRTIVSKIENNGKGYSISYNSSADRMECIIGNGASWKVVQSLNSWNLNQWYHVALVYDAVKDTMYYYQNGVLQGSIGVNTIYSNSTLKIGNDYWGDFWHGDIDEVRVFNVVRSSSEIQSTMNKELIGLENGLINYYNFNQGIADGNNTGITSIIDSKGTKNGTFNNFALNGSASNFKANDSYSNTINHSYSTSGNYNVKLITVSSYGCSDSITKTVHVRPQPTAGYSVSDTSLCLTGNNFIFTNTSTGTSNLWKFGDGLTSTSASPSHSYSSAGIYNVKLITSSDYNCTDSIAKNVYVKVQSLGNDVITACNSHTWIDGNTYTSSNNTATHTLTNASGCDSVVTLNLTINHSNIGTDIKTACNSYTWIDGNTYTSSNNTATHTLTNAIGCDSVVTLNLTINHSNNGIDVITACDSYTWIDGVTYTSSINTASHTLTNANGCDSVVTLNLTINQSNTGIDVKTACDSYTWIDGNTYTSSNNTATHTLTNANGCDSVVTLNLTINQSNTGTDMITACNSYTWIDGNTYTSSNNTATHTLTNASGCDSVVTLNLTINQSNTGIDIKTACNSYTWIDGNTYTSSNNTATHTLTNASGCDSVVTLNLTINHSNTGIDVKTACDSYTWIDGNIYTSNNNTATHTLINASGCDSVITLNLTINQSNDGIDVITACDSYTWIDGNTYTSSNNTATHTLTNASGCDSVVTLNLTINQSNTGIDVKTACDSYTWIDGNTYTSSNNTATHTLTNASGCDSVVTLNLTIYHSNTGIDVITACDSYTWIDGNTYTSSNNTATHTLTNASGCDSVVTLNLTINQSNTGIDIKTACNSYTWIDGNTYTSSNNTATHTLTNASGCDSVVTLNLTINHSNTGIDVKTACDSYTWIDGNIYTSNNNTATHTLINASGCDSVVTLNLTINYSSTGTDVLTACDSYTWIDGTTYTSSNNTATHALTNSSGCDSVVTLNLTINYSSTGTDMITACNSYTWIDGVTYTVNNNTATHNFIGGASNGCDSLVTLNLTINSADTSLVVSGLTITSQAVGATYQWLDCANSFVPIQNQTSNAFIAIENGSFAVEVTENGCTDTSFCVDITNVNIGNYQFANEINLYPNPTDGKVNIDFKEKQNEIKLIVRDITGKVILENIFSNTNRISFNMDEPKGFYTVELSSINQKAVFKLIKQ